jgi:hypothetical protein
MKAFAARLLGISRSLLEFYLPILRRILATGFAALLPLALEIVRNLAATDKTGAEKRTQAIDALRVAAVERGLEASENLLRYTIEAAVQKLKS